LESRDERVEIRLVFGVETRDFEKGYAEELTASPFGEQCLTSKAKDMEEVIIEPNPDSYRISTNQL